MHRKQRKVLNRSLDWIRRNLHATNLDVPEELVGLWIFEDDSDEDPRPPGFFFSVFAFGYMQYELLAGPVSAQVPRTVPVSRLVALFDLWQMKLALSEIHRSTSIQVEPVLLFSFPEGEHVKYWPKRLTDETADPASPTNS